MTIAFIHPFKSFLPEIVAYKSFFSKYKNIQIIEVDHKDALHIKADVKWYIMGSDFNKRGTETIKIHEYVSLSLPPFAHLKDWIKKSFSAKPDFRIFQNEFVKKELGFYNHITNGFRDMGVPENMMVSGNIEHKKKYDFIYIGSVIGRNIEVLINRFASDKLSNYSLLILSKDYDDLAIKYKRCKNIIFMGPVPHNEVQHYVSAARFAINFIPVAFPYNMQSSTKFIEYAACKIPVITTKYEWIKSFQKKYGGNYFYVKNDLTDFNIPEIMAFDYAFPDMSAWTWEQQINKSGVVNFLKMNFPQSF